MTSPYRLRDAFSDKMAAVGLLWVIGTAVSLGSVPMLSVTMPMAIVLVVLWCFSLLGGLQFTDSRLREVGGMQ